MAEQKKTAKKTANTKTAKPGNWWQPGRMYALIVFGFSFLLYFNTVFNDYNLDDELVTQNHQVTSKGWNVLKFNFDAFNSVELRDSSFAQKCKYFLPVVFRVPYYQDKAGFKYEYRPMVFVSFALEHALFASKDFTNGIEKEVDHPGISHFINVLLYALACLLLFNVLRMLFSGYSLLFPFVVSLVFAAYPMHTEVVASIKNRDEILALLFGLLAMKFALGYVAGNKKLNLLWVFVFLILGILSKPTTIIFALLVPLAIAMFSSLPFKRYVLLVTVLVLPAVIFSRLFTALQQIELGVALYASALFFYALKNREAFTAAIKKAIAEVPGYFKPGAVTATESAPVSFKFLTNPLVILGILVLGILPLAVSAFGVAIYNSWVACLPLVVFVVAYIIASDDLKVALITPLTLLAIYCMIKLTPEVRIIETGLIVFLSSQIFSGQKSFRLVGVLNYVLYSIVSVAVFHSFHFAYIILFLGLLDRRLMPVTLLAVAASVAYLGKKIYGLVHGHHNLHDALLLLPVVYLFVFLLWKKWWKVAINISVVMVPLFLLLYFTVIHPAFNTSPYYAVQRTYYRVSAVAAADPTPVKSVRPLRYMEYPVNTTDPASIKLGTSMEVLGNYLRMAVLTYPMSYYYGYSYITAKELFSAGPLVSLLLHLALFVTALFLFNRRPVISFAILFYLIAISVFADLVTPIPGMIGDRFLLIPSIGFCVLVVYLVFELLKQPLTDTGLTIGSVKTPVKIVFGVLLLLYSGLTFSRNQDWKDRLTLFRHDIRVVETSAQAQNLLAVHLFLSASQERELAVQESLMKEALPHFQKALEISPDFMNAAYDYGRTYEGLAKTENGLRNGANAVLATDSAFKWFERTVKMDTTFYAPYFNMAVIYQNRGQYAEAIPLYQKFLVKYPRQTEAYTNMSYAYFQMKDYANSIATNHRAIAATGDPFYPTVNIAKVYSIMGQPDSALYYYSQALQMKPDDANLKATVQQVKASMQNGQH